MKVRESDKGALEAYQTAWRELREWLLGLEKQRAENYNESGDHKYDGGALTIATLARLKLEELEKSHVLD